MSRRKIIDLPLLELFGRTGVRPLVTGLSSTNDRVSILENLIPEKVSTTLLAANWNNDDYSFETTYPAAITTIEIASTDSEQITVENQYIIHTSAITEGSTYQLFSNQGIALPLYIEISSITEENEEVTYSFNLYDDLEQDPLGTGTALFISTEDGYTIDVYLDEDIATRPQRDAFVDATLTGNTGQNVITALDGAPYIDIPIILEVVRTNGAADT